MPERFFRGEREEEKEKGVQSEKLCGLTKVRWVISAALDDWDERLSFPVV